MKVYIDRNNIQVELIRFCKIATLLSLESLKWDNFRNRCVYGIGLIAIRAVSPPFGEETWTCARNAWGRGSSKGFRLFAFPANKERRQLWNSRSIPRAGSLKNSCRQFTRPQKVPVYHSLDRLANASERY